MKYIDKMLIASGVTLLLTGGVAAAALAPGTADTVITQLPGEIAIFASNGPFGSPNTLATAATYIGITEAALRTELQTGQTLAQIAVAHGKTRDGLIAAADESVHAAAVPNAALRTRASLSRRSGAATPSISASAPPATACAAAARYRQSELRCHACAALGSSAGSLTADRNAAPSTKRR